jgi:hypothetical protein
MPFNAALWGYIFSEGSSSSLLVLCTVSKWKVAVVAEQMAQMAKPARV